MIALALLAGCSGSASDDASPGPSSEVSTSTASTAPVAVTEEVAQAPRATPEEAVVAVLTAEQAGDRATSYAVLSDEARRLYKDQAEWQDRRNELPPITGFTIEETASDQVIVTVEHEPGLDPFLGLAAGRERQEWTAVEVDGGWLVDAEPETEYLLPSDADAVSAALAWMTAVQACDDAAVLEQQALPELYGATTKLGAVCGAAGTPEAGAIGNLEAGPASADIVAQYSSDALIWARSVPVTSSGASFTISLAPIGDVWKVMGVSD